MSSPIEVRDKDGVHTWDVEIGDVSRCGDVTTQRQIERFLASGRTFRPYKETPPVAPPVVPAADAVHFCRNASTVSAARALCDFSLGLLPASKLSRVPEAVTCASCKALVSEIIARVVDGAAMPFRLGAHTMCRHGAWAFTPTEACERRHSCPHCEAECKEAACKHAAWAGPCIRAGSPRKEDQ